MAATNIARRGRCAPATSRITRITPAAIAKRTSCLCLCVRVLIYRLFQSRWIYLVVFRAAFLALGDLGDDRAVAWQRRAINHARRVPQLRAHDRLGALKIDALDLHHDDGARRLAGEDEAFAQRGI